MVNFFIGWQPRRPVHLISKVCSLLELFNGIRVHHRVNRSMCTFVILDPHLTRLITFNHRVTTWLLFDDAVTVFIEDYPCVAHRCFGGDRSWAILVVFLGAVEGNLRVCSTRAPFWWLRHERGQHLRIGFLPHVIVSGLKVRWPFIVESAWRSHPCSLMVVLLNSFVELVKSGFRRFLRIVAAQENFLLDRPSYYRLLI